MKRRTPISMANLNKMVDNAVAKHTKGKPRKPCGFGNFYIPHGSRLIDTGMSEFLHSGKEIL